MLAFSPWPTRKWHVFLSFLILVCSNSISHISYTSLIAISVDQTQTGASFLSHWRPLHGWMVCRRACCLLNFICVYFSIYFICAFILTMVANKWDIYIFHAMFSKRIGKHTVFGRVSAGMGVVRRMGLVETVNDRSGHLSLKRIFTHAYTYIHTYIHT